MYIYMYTCRLGIQVLGVQRHFQQYFSYIITIIGRQFDWWRKPAISFIGGGNQST